MPLDVPFCLLAALTARREAHIWIAAGAAVAIALATPSGVAPVALIAAAVLTWRGIRERRRGLAVGVVLALYLALRTIGWDGGPFPASHMAVDLLTAAAFVLVAWRLRLPAALLLLVPLVYNVRSQLPTLGPLAWGSLLLVAGFLSLAAGVAVNWRLRTGGADPELQRPLPDESSD